MVVCLGWSCAQFVCFMTLLLVQSSSSMWLPAVSCCDVLMHAAPRCDPTELPPTLKTLHPLLPLTSLASCLCSCPHTHTHTRPHPPPTPTALALGPGGVLLHAASGRPVPHSCVLGPQGGLLSSDGKPLPDSMAVGPNRWVGSTWMYCTWCTATGCTVHHTGSMCSTWSGFRNIMASLCQTAWQ